MVRRVLFIRGRDGRRVLYISVGGHEQRIIDRLERVRASTCRNGPREQRKTADAATLQGSEQIQDRKYSTQRGQRTTGKSTVDALEACTQQLTALHRSSTDSDPTPLPQRVGQSKDGAGEVDGRAGKVKGAGQREKEQGGPEHDRQTRRSAAVEVAGENGKECGGVSGELGVGVRVSHSLQRCQRLRVHQLRQHGGVDGVRVRSRGSNHGG